MPESLPVAMPTLASGCCVHHVRTWPASAVASLNPCAVSGCLAPGTSGKTCQPFAAYWSAASRREFRAVASSPRGEDLSAGPEVPSALSMRRQFYTQRRHG